MKLTTLVKAALIGATLAATMPVLAAPAHAVPNLVRIYNHTTASSASLQIIAAQCPEGTKVLGGGAFISGDDDRRIHFTMLEALPVTNRYIAEAKKEAGSIDVWSMQVWALCGLAPFGLEYLSAQTAYDNSAHKSATVSCPSGKQTLSHGMQITGGNGDVMIGGFGPTGGLNGTKGNANVTQAGTGAAGDWRFKVTAVCANPMLGQTLVYKDSSPILLSVEVSPTATCPAGTKVHGGGAAIFSSLGQITITKLEPDSLLNSMHATMKEDFDQTPQQWWARVYAVCAP